MWNGHEKNNIASLECYYNSSLIIVNINFGGSEVNLTLKTKGPLLMKLCAFVILSVENWMLKHILRTM